MKRLGRVAKVICAAMIGIAVSPFAWAQSYPDRAVRIIVPYAPGGPTDITGRLLSQKLTEQLGKQFYVENIGGVGGNIGMGRAAQSSPDGYSILLTASTLAINPVLYDKVPFDPVKDFEPVTLVVKAPAALLTVHPSVPAQNVKELVARINPIAQALPLIRDGKLRAYGVTTAYRIKALPDVPAIGEVVKDYDAIGWYGLAAPAKTPPEIISKLGEAMNAAIADPKVNERFVQLGVEPMPLTPEGFKKHIAVEAEKWGKVIKTQGIEVN